MFDRSPLRRRNLFSPIVDHQKSRIRAAYYYSARCGGGAAAVYPQRSFPAGAGTSNAGLASKKPSGIQWKPA